MQTIIIYYKHCKGGKQHLIREMGKPDIETTVRFGREVTTGGENSRPGE